MADRLEDIYRSLVITRSDCESGKGFNCEDCPAMPGCHIALAVIHVEVLRGAKLVDVGQAIGELKILEVALRSMDWECLAREHPDLLAEEIQSLVLWRVTNALGYLSVEAGG